MIVNLVNDNGRVVNNHYIIVENDGTVALQSYKSRVCEIRKGGLGFDKVVVFGKDWNYSRTTMKYLSKFLRQNGLEIIASAKDIRDGLERGHARTDASIAMWEDTTM